MFKYLLILFYLSSISLSAQNEFGKSFIIGTSLTYIPDYSNTINADYNFNEFTWNLNAAVSISKRVYIGAQVLSIFTNGSRISNQNYTIIGLFSQFNFLPKQKFRFFAELSINTGNYCTCGYLDPFNYENLVYIGWGGGFDLPLHSVVRNLYIDLSFIAYLITNNVESKYGYTQYIIGLNYRFGKQTKNNKKD